MSVVGRELSVGEKGKNPIFVFPHLQQTINNGPLTI